MNNENGELLFTFCVEDKKIYAVFEYEEKLKVCERKRGFFSVKDTVLPYDDEAYRYACRLLRDMSRKKLLTEGQHFVLRSKELDGEQRKYWVNKPPLEEMLTFRDISGRAQLITCVLLSLFYCIIGIVTDIDGEFLPFLSSVPPAIYYCVVITAYLLFSLVVYFVLVRKFEAGIIDVMLFCGFPLIAELLFGWLNICGLPGYAAALFIVPFFIAVVFLRILVNTDLKTKEDRKKLRKFSLATIRTAYAAFAVAVVLVAVAPDYLTTNTRLCGYVREDREFVEPSVYLSARSLLADGPWKDLTTEEKLDCLNKIAAYEADVMLGCNAPEIAVSDSLGEAVLGQYDRTEDTVVLSSELFDEPTSEQTFVVLIHEIRHKYQWCMLQMIYDISEINPDYLQLDILSDAVMIYKNYMADGYISSADDMLSYQLQFVEIDANEYVDERIEAEYQSFYPNYVK